MFKYSTRTSTHLSRCRRPKSRHQEWGNESKTSLVYSSHLSTSFDEEAKKIDYCDTWYYPDIKQLPEPTRKIFEEYSGIPPEQVIPHIQGLALKHNNNHLQRSRAFKIYPYPCLGQLRFLNLSLSRHPLYPEVLSRLQQNTNDPTASQNLSLSIDRSSKGITYTHQHPQKFLDLGCCLAQDLRKLVVDGAPAENLYGLDLEGRFIDLGYDLFRDHQTLKSRFVVADLQEDEQEEEEEEEEHNRSPQHPPTPPDPSSLPTKLPASALSKQISIIAANSFFHLYNLPQQLALAKRVVRFLSPERGSLILGRQVGSLVPGEYTSVDNKGTRYAHNVDSFQRFWEQVASEVGGGCRFRVEATLDEEELGENKNQGQHWSEPNIRRLLYGVWRE